MKVSKRLEAMADLVERGSVAADIGTDHGQLPCYLVRQGICPHVIAADVGAQPLASAQKRIAAMGLNGQITTRLGNGLAVLEPGEAATVTISGMGGGLITEILNDGQAVVNTLRQLVLQPNLAASVVRRWAMEQGWHIEREQLLYEEGHYYEVLDLRPGERQALTMAEIWLGPWLLATKHPLLVAYVQSQWLAEKRILAQINQSQAAKAWEKRQALEEKWRIIDEVMRCQLGVAIL